MDDKETTLYRGKRKWLKTIFTDRNAVRHVVWRRLMRFAVTHCNVCAWHFSAIFSFAVSILNIRARKKWMKLKEAAWHLNNFFFGWRTIWCPNFFFHYFRSLPQMNHKSYFFIFSRPLLFVAFYRMQSKNAAFLGSFNGWACIWVLSARFRSADASLCVAFRSECVANSAIRHNFNVLCHFGVVSLYSTSVCLFRSHTDHVVSVSSTCQTYIPTRTSYNVVFRFLLNSYFSFLREFFSSCSLTFKRWVLRAKQTTFE